MVGLIIFTRNLLNKITLSELFIVFLVSFFVKKILILYIIINITIPFRLAYIIFKKKMYTKNIIDCAIIKIISNLSGKKEKYEKLDNVVFFFISYLTIFFFSISPKSISISRTLYLEMKENTFITKKNPINAVIKTIEKEFLIRNANIGFIKISKIIIKVDPDI